MKAIVFLGPSLPRPAARQILDAYYLPPAAQSDLLSAAMAFQPDVIGLIDGTFSESLSVWHKEILFALHRGIRVYGAASMGALRAAETSAFGMVGIGKIYHMYASGEITGDDEVAVAHASEEFGYRPLTEPMVNVRATLQQALATHTLTEEEYTRLIAVAKSIFFRERTVSALCARATEAGLSNDLIQRCARIFSAAYVDLKRQDTIQLLQTIRTIADAPRAPAPKVDLVESGLFQAQYQRDRTVRHDGTDLPLAAIGNYVALHEPAFTDLNFNALNRMLVVLMARMYKVAATAEDTEREARRFRQKHQLLDDTRFGAWLRQNDLHPTEFDELMAEVALCRRMQQWLKMRLRYARNTKAVLDELRLSDRYLPWAMRAARQERILREQYPDFKEMSHRDIPITQLVMDHAHATGARFDLPIADWAAETGFRTPDELALELARARLARQHEANTPVATMNATKAGYRGEPISNWRATNGFAYHLQQIDSGETAAYTRMTFPAYQSMLAAAADGDCSIIALGAFGNDPLGLALGHIHPDGDAATVDSLYVVPGQRRHGVGTALLAALEDLFWERGVHRIGLVYMTGKPDTVALERVLEKRAWEPAQTRMLVAKCLVKGVQGATWLRRAKLPAGFEVLPWDDLTEHDRLAIQERQHAHPWIPDKLSPFDYEMDCEPRTSLALRRAGEIEGWIITHRLGPETIRYTCGWVRKELQHVSGVLPYVGLIAASVSRLDPAQYQYGIWTVPMDLCGMVALTKRHMAPFAVYLRETKGTSKVLAGRVQTSEAGGPSGNRIVGIPVPDASTERATYREHSDAS